MFCSSGVKLYLNWNEKIYSHVFSYHKNAKNSMEDYYWDGVNKAGREFVKIECAIKTNRQVHGETKHELLIQLILFHSVPFSL